MRVFKPTYKDRDGRKQETDKWYVEFRNHDGKVRRLPGFTDRKQTEELGRKIEKLVAARAARSIVVTDDMPREEVPAEILVVDYERWDGLS